MPKSVVVYGPTGCGKTRNAERMLKAFGLQFIYDGYSGEPLLPEGVLALTNRTDIPGSISFDEAMQRVGP